MIKIINILFTKFNNILKVNTVILIIKIGNLKQKSIGERHRGVSGVRNVPGGAARLVQIKSLFFTLCLAQIKVANVLIFIIVTLSCFCGARIICF